MSKKDTVAIAGTGYVGLSNAILLAQHNRVFAMDIIEDKVNMINNRVSPIADREIEEFLQNADLDLTATLDAEQAYSEAELAIDTIAPIRGTLANSAASLKAGLDTLYAAAQKVELVYLYASLDKHGDNGDAAAQAREGRAMKLYVKFSTAASFVDPEILAMDEALLEEYLKADSLKG